MKRPHWTVFFWPTIIVVILLAATLLPSCAVMEPPDIVAQSAGELNYYPGDPVDHGPEASRAAVSFSRLDLPYVIAQLGNTDVWTASQGLGAPVSDNWLTSGPQTQQSAHRVLKDELGTAYHRAKVLAYIVDTDEVPIGYRMQGGGFFSPDGVWIAPCIFFAGLDSYMEPMYYDPIADQNVWAIGRARTADGYILPVFGIDQWISIRVFDGRWWNGDHPLHSWLISGI